MSIRRIKEHSAFLLAVGLSLVVAAGASPSTRKTVNRKKSLAAGQASNGKTSSAKIITSKIQITQGSRIPAPNRLNPSIGTPAPLGQATSGTSIKGVLPAVTLPRTPAKAGVDLTATYTASAKETSDRDRVSSLDFELAPWVAVGRNYKADGYVSVAKDLNGYLESKVTDARLGFFHNPIPLSKVWQYRPKVTVFLPVDSEKRDVNSFRTAVSMGNRFLFERGNLTGFWQTSFGKNFYQYTTTGAGDSNPSFSVSNSLKANLSFGKFYLEVTPAASTRWTYEGTPSTTFDIAEEIGMGLGAWTIGLGHTNSDSLYQANGSDSNFTFFNGNTSKLYLTANLTF